MLYHPVAGIAGSAGVGVIMDGSSAKCSAGPTKKHLTFLLSA
jgi:hypothetical protein